MKFSVRVSTKIQLNKSTVLHVIFFLFLCQFVLSYLTGEWTFSNEKYSIVPFYNTAINMIRLAYVGILLGLSGYEAVRHWKRLQLLDRLLLILFLAIVILRMVEVAPLVDLQTLLLNNGVPTVYLGLLAFFIGMDEELRAPMRRLTRAYGAIFIMLAIVYFLLFCLKEGYSVGMRFASGPILYAFNTGFSCLLYAMYQEKQLRGDRYWYVMLPLLTLAALITTARSWVVHAVVMIVMYFLLQRKGQKILQSLFRAALGAGVIYLVTRLLAPGVVTTVLNRLHESTRSEQLESFFRQIPLRSLLGGLGYNATYSFSKWTNFQFIDNQFIFGAFRYGAVIMLLYAYFLFKPFLWVLFQRDREEKLRAVGLLHYLLVLSGLAIYFAINLEPANIIPYVMAGTLYETAHSSGKARERDAASDGKEATGDEAAE